MFAKTTENVMDNARRVSDDAMKAGRNVWLAGLGAVALAEEEARSLFDRLVVRGEKFEKSDKNLVGKTIEDAADVVKKVGDRVESAVQSTFGVMLNRAGVPSRSEIRTLIDRVEELNKKVEKLA